MEIHYICTYEDSKMRPTKHGLKNWGRERGGIKYNGTVNLLEGSLYLCMELPQ
jgi:hypothetical protein